MNPDWARGKTTAMQHTRRSPEMWLAQAKSFGVIDLWNNQCGALFDKHDWIQKVFVDAKPLQEQQAKDHSLSFIGNTSHQHCNPVAASL